MSALCLLFWTVLILHAVSSVPIVLKESTPNGESIIAISSSDPEVEKYFLNSYVSQRANPESLLRSNFYNSEVQNYNSGVQSFSAASPERSIAGTSRSFGQTNPFFVPFLVPNIDGLQLNNWFRNIENVYPDVGFGSNGEVRTVTALNDNGHVYGEIETVNLDKKRPTF